MENENVNSQVAQTEKVEPQSQKNAVLKLAQEALTAAGKDVVSGQKVKELITKEVRKTIRQRLFQGIRAGEIKLARPMDDSKLKKYCSSLINNWLKKDPRFN